MTDPTMKEYIHRMTAESTRLHAEVAHWKAAQAQTQKAGHDAILKMYEVFRRYQRDVYDTIKEEGRGCKDCDVKALLAELDSLFPVELQDLASSERARS